MTSNNGRYSAPSFNGILDLKPWYEMCVCCGLNGILDLKPTRHQGDSNLQPLPPSLLPSPLDIVHMYYV